MMIGRVRYDLADKRLERHWQDEEDLRKEVCVYVHRAHQHMQEPFL